MVALLEGTVAQTEGSAGKPCYALQKIHERAPDRHATESALSSGERAALMRPNESQPAVLGHRTQLLRTDAVRRPFLTGRWRFAWFYAHH
jgi:hypothetical protein